MRDPAKLTILKVDAGPRREPTMNDRIQEESSSGGLRKRNYTSFVDTTENAARFDPPAFPKGQLDNDAGISSTAVDEDETLSTTLSERLKISMLIPKHTEKSYAEQVERESSSNRTLCPRLVYIQGQVPYTQLEPLGSSISGIEVHTAGNFQAGKVFVRKVLQVRLLSSVEEASHELQALQIPRTLHQQHLLSIVTTYEEIGPEYRRYGILMEPVAGCNLKQFLERSSDSKLTAQQLQGLMQKWFGCLATCLSYLHARGIAHRGIDPTHILVKGEDIFLTEFAITQYFKNCGMIVGFNGQSPLSQNYWPPEKTDNFKTSTAKADVFSLGLIYLEMLATLAGLSMERFIKWLVRIPIVPCPERRSEYRNHLRKIPEFLVVLQEKLPTALLRSMVICCQSMLTSIPEARFSSFQVADFVYNSFQRLEPDYLEHLCDCMDPWKGCGDAAVRISGL
jgi:serine/threonine protein kinase